jgi:hypothetical protein
MNNFSQTIIDRFTSHENIDYLYSRLSHFFTDQRVNSYLSEYLSSNVNNFAEVIKQELAISDPFPGSSIQDHIMCFNNQFIKTQILNIENHVIGTAPSLFTITDSNATTRHGRMHYNMPTSHSLDSWYFNPGRPIQTREDNQSDIYSYNTFNGMGENLTTGITFCDQSGLNMNTHIERYENTPYKAALNAPYGHENTVFGVSTLDTDKRLLERRTFRTGGKSGENGVPYYEKALYSRNLDRNIDEGLRNAEKGCLSYGYDTDSIRCRLNHKKNIRDKYLPHIRRPELGIASKYT